LDTFISKPWYIQQQQVTQYLPEELNYCVSAQYTLFERATFWGYTVGVRNLAYNASGAVTDSGDTLAAYATDSSDPAKLAVAPYFLPKALAGPYWVLHYSEEEGYALIAGGQPTVYTPEGCRTGSGTNDAGLWLFTHAQQRNETLVQKLRGFASDQGFDLSVLNDVDQTNCPSLPAASAAFPALPDKSALAQRGHSPSVKNECPPVRTQPGFDLDTFISKPWYIQQQQVTQYLPEELNYCVSAQYTLFERATFWGYTVGVRNLAYNASGAVTDSGDTLAAYATDSSDPAKLAVAPYFLPKALAGPYWVLHYSEEEGYALIAGGQPTVYTPEGCRTGSGTNDAGLWLFTHAQQRNETLVQKLRGFASDQGFDLSVLNDVDQTNCPALPA